VFRAFLAFAVLAVARLPAQVLALDLSEGELSSPPSPERVAAIVNSAAQTGWEPWVGPLRAAALKVYQRDAAAAEPWYHLYRWANKLATPQAQATQAWMKAIEEARLVNANMPRYYPDAQVAAPLGNLISPELQRWALSHAEFSEEFFNIESPLDEPGNVLRILQSIYAVNPERFAEYASLALAVAVVYDTPPPPDWPHGQVSPTALPRRLPAPLEAFAYWTRLDLARKSALPLQRLPANELKFVVDAAAPFSDLAWAQANIPTPLAQFAQVYDMVKYRNDRVTNNAFIWPGDDYRLATILQTGGICIDQAYFASSVGKARGVPTLLFHGVGQDGRHAWFGYLSATGWVLDAGRYAEQKFVVGQAFDPQTWRYLNDHELLFLSERFHALPLYKLSVINADFAEEFLRDHNAPAAVKAAREAVNREPHNLHGWELLILAETSAGATARDVEGTLHQAEMAFQKYPDLEVSFSRLLAQSLRQRGEASAATAEEQRLVHKYQTNRTDLSVQAAADMLDHSIEGDDFPTQVKTYQTILATYGTGAGIDFYDRIVSRFARHCKDVGQPGAALQALDRARQTLRVEAGGQLDQEMTRFAAELRGTGVQ
jgi:hypothetical protein